MAKAESLIIKLIGKDQFSKVFGKAEEQMSGLRKGINKFGAIGLAAGGAFAVGIGIKAVSAAAKFEAGMSNVATLLDTSTENMDDMGKKVREIAKRVPADMEDLTTSLYNVRSAGISASDAMGVLEKSAKLAMAGLGTTEEAVDLVTSAINAFELQGKEADDVYAQIFNTVKMGKTTIAGLAQGFGAVAGTIAAANIELPSYLAAVSALTTTGLPAAQAHTQMKAAVAGLTRESGDLTKVLNRLNVSTFKELVDKSNGDVVPAFKAIVDEVEGNDAMILKLFGSTEAYNAVVALSTTVNGKYVEALESSKTAQGALDDATKKQTETAAAQYKLLKNNLNVVMVDLGNKILPVLVDIMKELPFWMNVISDLWDKWTTALSKVFLAVDKAVNAMKSVIDLGKRAGGAVGDFFTGAGRGEKNIPWLPFFQKGGIVPGPIGAPIPAVVHGGETIIPAGGAAGNVFNFNFSGAFIGNIDDFKRQLIDLINRKSELRALGGE